MKRHLIFNDVWYYIALIWCLSFLAGFAHGEESPKGTMYELAKPVTCTQDPYKQVKQTIQTSYREVGALRFITSEESGIEVFVNPTTGTFTILEFLPDSKTTCILSSGGEAEINQKFLDLFKPSGTFAAIKY